jgi:hypothetical protein
MTLIDAVAAASCATFKVLENTLTGRRIATADHI